jgi:hypothetical protein
VDEGWLRIVAPLYWLSAVGILAGAAVRLGKSRTAGLLGAVLLFFVPEVVAGECGVLTGYVDFPLGVAFMAALGWLLRCEGIGAARLCGMVMAVGTWTKLEGRYLWLMIVTMAFAILWKCAWKEKRWKEAAGKLIWITLPGALVLCGWALFLQGYGVETHAHHLRLTLSNLSDNAWRVGSVAMRIASEPKNWESWSFLWPGLILAILTFLVRKEWRNAFVFAFVAISAPAIFVVVYTLSTWQDYLLHMDTSLPRLFLQLAPAALLAISLAIPNRPQAREPFISLFGQ